MRIVPLFPDAVVPVDITRMPLLPREPLAAVRITTDPAPELTLLPEAISTDPPEPAPKESPATTRTTPATALASEVVPAIKVTPPPLPTVEGPTTTLTPPLRPPDAAPVASTAQPLFPDFVVPEDRITLPDTPADEEGALAIITEPEPALTLEPEVRTTAPPTPEPPAAPADMTTAPPLADMDVVSPAARPRLLPTPTLLAPTTT